MSVLTAHTVQNADWLTKMQRAHGHPHGPCICRLHAFGGELFITGPQAAHALSGRPHARKQRAHLRHVGLLLQHLLNVPHAASTLHACAKQAAIICLLDVRKYALQVCCPALKTEHATFTKLVRAQVNKLSMGLSQQTLSMGSSYLYHITAGSLRHHGAGALSSCTFFVCWIMRAVLLSLFVGSCEQFYFLCLLDHASSFTFFVCWIMRAIVLSLFVGSFVCWIICLLEHARASQCAAQQCGHEQVEIEASIRQERLCGGPTRPQRSSVDPVCQMPQPHFIGP